MNRAILILAALALLLGRVGQAEAGIVTFDDAAGNAVLFQQFATGGSFSDGGLTFTNSAGSGLMYVWDGGSPNSNGTNNNIFGFGTGDTEVITKTGGGTFNLASIDFAISWYDPNPTDLITVNGNPLVITTTLTTYNLNLTGVTSVTISGVASDSGYWLADNVTFDAGVSAVPEPATVTMLGIGLAGLAGYGVRRRKQRAAIA